MASRIGPPYISQDSKTYIVPHINEEREPALKRYDLTKDRLDFSLIVTPANLMRAGLYIGLELGKVLQQNSTLHTLDLSGCPLHERAIPEISGALTSNITLENLVLRYTPVKVEAIRALANALSAQCSLTSLNMEGVALTILGHDHQISLSRTIATELAMALTINTKLNQLDLSSNRIEEEGGQALAAALKVNTALITLHLRRNSIGDEGVEAIGKALLNNPTLTLLNLEDSKGLGERAFRAIAELISANTPLQTLSLMDSEVDNQQGCTLRLAQAMATNTHLTSLAMGHRYRPVHLETITRLTSLLFTKTTPTHLDIGTYQGGQTTPEKTALDAIIARNHGNLYQKEITLYELLLPFTQL